MCFLSCFHHGVGVKDLTLLHCKSIKYINLFWLYLLPQLHRRDEELSEENQQYLFGKYATCRCIIAFHDLKTSRQWYRSGWLHKNVHLPAPAKSCPWGSDANRAEESKVPFGALQSSCAGSPGCTPNGSLVALTCCFLTWSLSPFVTHSAPVCHPHLYSWSQQLWWDYFMIICMVPVCISLICSIQVSMNSFTFARDNKGRTWFALPASLSRERKLYLFLGSVWEHWAYIRQTSCDGVISWIFPF